LPSQKEESLFDWEGVPQHSQSVVVIDHSNFSMF
jgi:hypothetical protein